jgi:hypothetical protein
VNGNHGELARTIRHLITLKRQNQQNAPAALIGEVQKLNWTAQVDDLFAPFNSYLIYLWYSALQQQM